MKLAVRRSHLDERGNVSPSENVTDEQNRLSESSVYRDFL